jgi:hypothetical protein
MDQEETMETITFQKHVGEDKMLKLEIPVDMPDADYEITVRALTPITANPTEQEEWIAFVNRTAGSLADDPIERGPQGAYEVREPLE